MSQADHYRHVQRRIRFARQAIETIAADPLLSAKERDQASLALLALEPLERAFPWRRLFLGIQAGLAAFDANPKIASQVRREDADRLAELTGQED